MKLTDFVIEIPEHINLISEMRDMYLFLYGMEKGRAALYYEVSCVDNVGAEDEYNLVFNMDKVLDGNKDRFPNLVALKETPLGKELGPAGFFTETDTRTGQDRRLDNLDMHKHVESVGVINFPLSHCNEDTTIGFHKLTEEEHSRTHLCDLGGVYLTDGRWYKEPNLTYSSLDGLPIILNVKEWHSVDNKANARRICGGWYFNRTVTWQDLLELTHQQ